MSKNRPQSASKTKLTPWVGRLMLGQAAIFVLLKSVLTAPVFTDALRFMPDHALERPWTFLSYMFVHQGILALGANLLLLFVFGPPVERRFGSRDFLFYYLYCGLGASAFALGLTSIMTVPAMVGATGATLGVILAFAFSGSDTKTKLLPFQVKLSARTLIILLAGTCGWRAASPTSVIWADWPQDISSSEFRGLLCDASARSRRASRGVPSWHPCRFGRQAPVLRYARPSLGPSRARNIRRKKSTGCSTRSVPSAYRA